MSASTLEQCAGCFRYDAGMIEVRREGGELVVRLPTGTTARLLERSPGVFQIQGGGAGRVAAFRQFEGNRFTTLELRQGDRVFVTATRVP